MQKYIYAQGPRSGALLFLLILISGMFCGCASHSDITRTNQAAQLGVLGRHFRTTVSLTLIYDRPSDTYRLVTRQYDFASVEHRIRRIGELPAGAHLSVKKVVMVDELAAFMVLPVTYRWTCTLANLEDGPYAGKDVAIKGEPLGLVPGHQTVAVIGSALLEEQGD